MADVKRVGPCHAFLGNPTVAGGTGMRYLGHTRGDVTVAPGINIAFGRADQRGRTPLADGVYTVGPTPVVSLPLLDEEREKIRDCVPGSVLTTGGGETALGFGSGFARIALAAIPTLILLPVDQVTQGTNGINADDMVVLPAAIARDIGQFTFNLPDGEDVFSPHEVQFAGLLRDADQGAAAIPAAHRAIFYGPPLALGLTWFLPTATP